MTNDSSTHASADSLSEEITRSEHPSLAIPFRLHIAGRCYEGLEISLVGLTALGTIGVPPQNPFEAQLEFPFAGFSVNVDAKLSLRTDSEAGTTECKFADLLGPHRMPLQSIFNSYIAGELVHVPGLVGGRSPAAKVADAQPRGILSAAIDAISRAAKAILFAVLALGLLAFVADRLYLRLFVYSPKSVARLAGDTLPIVARRTGTIVAVNDQAGVGQVLVSVLSDGTSLTNYFMPCDCKLANGTLAVGGIAEEGRALAVVMSKGSGLYVATEVEPDRIHDLRAGSAIQITFADGSTAPAKLRNVPYNGGQISDLVPVTLSIDSLTATHNLGDVVAVTVDRFPVFQRNVVDFIVSITGVETWRKSLQ